VRSLWSLQRPARTVHQLRMLLVNRYFGLCIINAGIISKAGEPGARGVGSCGAVRSTLDSKSLFVQILLMIQPLRTTVDYQVTPA
jgi:hypothetical protein